MKDQIYKKRDTFKVRPKPRDTCSYEMDVFTSSMNSKELLYYFDLPHDKRRKFKTSTSDLDLEDEEG